MRIIVISDTHGRFDIMEKIFERNDNAQLFIFLGDGEREFDEAKDFHKNKKTFQVSGNCDMLSLTPDMILTEAEGKRILVTHGHKYGVKSGTTILERIARERGAEIVLFGHTHQRYYSYENGIHFLNPGSAAQPRDGKGASYAFIDITKAGIVCNHVDV